MNINDIMHHLISSENIISAREADQKVPSSPGVYAIFIDNAENMPSLFNGYLVDRQPKLLYIGKATKNLYKRLAKQDLRHKEPSTFFRGLGAVKGFTPPPGSLRNRRNKNNYKFNEEDTEAIIRYINVHLWISWLIMDSENIKETETSLINMFKPLLNTIDNTNPIHELAVLRQKCREIACT